MSNNWVIVHNFVEGKTISVGTLPKYEACWSMVTLPYRFRIFKNELLCFEGRADSIIIDPLIYAGKCSKCNIIKYLNENTWIKYFYLDLAE